MNVNYDVAVQIRFYSQSNVPNLPERMAYIQKMIAEKLAENLQNCCSVVNGFKIEKIEYVDKSV